jgi:hypothetical protein
MRKQAYFLSMAISLEFLMIAVTLPASATTPATITSMFSISLDTSCMPDKTSACQLASLRLDPGERPEWAVLYQVQ